MKTIRSLRVVAAFALLGAVVTGVLAGWVENPSIDPRAVGAVIGAAAAVIHLVAQLLHT